MTWKAPPGVNRTGLPAAVRAAEAKFNGQIDPKSHDFLTGNVKESWRVFLSTFIQHSTGTHLALGDLLAKRFGAFANEPDWTRVRMLALKHEFGPAVEEFAVQYYTSTQALRNHFGSYDASTIQLYRGVRKHTAEVLLKDLALPGYRAFLNLNPLSSWATEIKLAERFAKRGGGMVVQMDLPKNMIFAHYEIDDLMMHLLDRQIGQHLGGGTSDFGGEAIVWCPLCCIPVKQEHIVRDYTQLDAAKSLGGT